MPRYYLLRGRAPSLTAYDTAYLALRQACPLATPDRKLLSAARELGIAIVEEWTFDQWAI